MTQITNFFLAANSAAGIQNRLADVLTEEETYDLMILKGGPGSGKRSFMAELGRTMEQAGVPVEYIQCAGDPDALDGVVFPSIGCAAVDGTAPHVLEPRFPAAVDRCVDLGRFYDLMAAKERRQAIQAGVRACAAARERAFRYLRAAREMELDAMQAAAVRFDRERAERRLRGIIGRELRRKGKEQGRTVRRFLGSCTGRGYIWRFDTVQALCPRVYVLSDSWGLGGPLLETLHRTAVSRGWDVIACISPEEPETIEHLLVPGLGLAFVTSRPGMAYEEKPYRRIRLDAMTEPVSRTRQRFDAGMVRVFREKAVTALQEAGTAHNALEEEYLPYLDIDGVQALAAVEAGRLLSRLHRS